MGPKRSMRTAAAVMAGRRLVVAIFLMASSCLVVGASAEAVNTQVQRKIDVSTQFAKVSMREGGREGAGSPRFLSSACW